jgi:AcrR family transcriptional regulator
MNKRSGIESKKKILAAAIKVFSSSGYANANMRMIAKASGLSIGSIYLYFKNKEDLFLTLIKSRLDAILDLGKEILDKNDTPENTLRLFISRHLDFTKKHKELLLIQGREHCLTFGIQMKRKFFKIQRKRIEEIIRRGVNAGIFQKCNVKEIARIIHCTLRGFILSMLIDTNALFSPEEFSNIILRGLKKGER